MDWINVNDRLPESGKEVLLHCKEYAFKCVGVYTKGGDIEVDDEDGDNEDLIADEQRGLLFLKEGWYQECEQLSGSYDYCWCNRDVTHWMPLPPAPKI